MATITPTLATSLVEINKEIVNSTTSIIITNKNLFPAIKKRFKSIKINNNMNKASKIAGFGMLAMTVLSAEITIPVGLTLAGASFLLGRTTGFVKQAGQYKVLDLSQKSDTEDFLVLLKVKGQNSFNENNDVLDLENFKAPLSENNNEVHNEDSI